MFTAYREVSDGSQPRTESDHVVAREAHGDVVTEPPRNQETSGRPASAATTRPTRWFDVLNRLWWKARQRRVVYLMVFCLCFLAAAAIFTVVILESLRVESASISGGIRAIVLAIFCTPLVTYVCVTVVVIFRILRAALIDNQLDSQAHWDAYRGVMINVIEGCVVYPAILLNIIRAHSQGYGSQNALDYIAQVPTIIFSLVWITHWFSGGQDTPEESANQGSTGTPSRGDHPMGTGEANNREPPEHTPGTYDSFRHGGAMETATLVAD